MSQKKQSAEPKVVFEATPAQSKFADAVFSGQYRYLAYGGGIRSGKTATSLMLVQSLCKVFPGSRWAIVRKDLPTMKSTTLVSFQKFRIDGFVERPMQGPHGYTSKCTNGSEIVFFTESLADDPDMNRWRGLEVNGFFAEEANELHEKSFTKMKERAGAWVVPGMSAEEQPPILCVFTFNPSAGWVKRTFYDPYQAGTLAAPYYYQPATILDNPHLPPDYVASLKSLPERDYKRFVEGDWSFISGAFFSELAWATHSVPRKDNPDPKLTAHQRWANLPSWWRYWSSYDWGYRHPAVFMAFGMNGDGQVFLLDTLRMHRLDDAEQAERVVQAMPPVCLAAGAYSGHDVFAQQMAHAPRHETVADVFWGKKIRLSKANIARVPGAAQVRRLLTRKQPDGSDGVPRVLVCDTPGNRWAFEQWMELQPDDTNPDDVLKMDANEDGQGGDDAYDCLVGSTLIDTAMGPVPIAAVRAGDMVATRSGFRRVYAQWLTGRAMTYRVNLSNGRTLTGTGAHPVFVEGAGFLRLDSLRYGDVVRGDARNVYVVNVERAGIADVYNFQVQDPAAPEYYANGVLVHNCARYGLASPSWLPIEPAPERDLIKFGDPPKQPDWKDTNAVTDELDQDRQEVPGAFGSRLGHGW